MQQIFHYVQNTNVYHCPGNVQLPVNNAVGFNYFQWRAGGGMWLPWLCPVDSRRISFPAAYVLSGDTIDNDKYFSSDDSDKGRLHAELRRWRDEMEPDRGPGRRMAKARHVLFADGHSKWYKGYDAGEMTFRYDSMHGWEVIHFPLLSWLLGRFKLAPMKPPRQFT